MRSATLAAASIGEPPTVMTVWVRCSTRTGEVDDLLAVVGDGELVDVEVEALWLSMASSKPTLVQVTWSAEAELFGHRVGDGGLVALAVRSGRCRPSTVRTPARRWRWSASRRSRSARRPVRNRRRGRRKPRWNRPSPPRSSLPRMPPTTLPTTLPTTPRTMPRRWRPTRRRPPTSLPRCWNPTLSRTSSRPGRADRQRRRPSGLWWWTNEDDSWRSSLGRAGGSPVGGLGKGPQRRGSVAEAYEPTLRSGAPLSAGRGRSHLRGLRLGSDPDDDVLLDEPAVVGGRAVQGAGQ